jgi:dipeptidase D
VSEIFRSYPGWTPNAQSEILDVLVPIYEKQNGDKPRVVACHVGLECGILGTNYPDMDMISLVQLSTERTLQMKEQVLVRLRNLEILIEILANIPVK